MYIADEGTVALVRPRDPGGAASDAEKRSWLRRANVLVAPSTMGESFGMILLEGMASEYNFMTQGLTSGMAKVEAGDSGSPAFLVVGGKLALLGTHWKIDTDCMVSGIIPGMNAIMAADGAKLDVVPLGE